MEEGGFGLRHFVNLAVHLRSRSLVEADFGVDDADRFQQMQGAEAGDVGGRHRLFEGDADEALRGEVVDFVGLGLLQNPHAGAGVGQIVLDQVEVGVILDAEFFQTPEVDRAGAAVGAEDPIAFVQ